MPKGGGTRADFDFDFSGRERPERRNALTVVFFVKSNLSFFLVKFKSIGAGRRSVNRLAARASLNREGPLVARGWGGGGERGEEGVGRRGCRRGRAPYTPYIFPLRIRARGG